MQREFSSGGVVYKKVEKGVLWLVTKSSPSVLYPESIWRLPKGWIDNKTRESPGPIASGKIKADLRSLEAAALREVAEEGGVQAKIIKKIGTIEYFLNLPKGKIMKFVTFFLMEYKGDRPEGFDDETSEVKWLTFDEAYKLITYKNEKEVLKKAESLLAQFGG